MNNTAQMKLLVRNSQSQKFLRATGRWTRKAEAACNFPNVYNAVHTCLAKGLDNVELVIRIEGDNQERCCRLNRL
jgi:hypothetical protein